MPRDSNSYDSVALPAAMGRKLRDASEVTRVPKAQILRQLIDLHLDDWLRDFYRDHPAANR